MGNALTSRFVGRSKNDLGPYPVYTLATESHEPDYHRWPPKYLIAKVTEGSRLVTPTPLLYPQTWLPRSHSEARFAPILSTRAVTGCVPLTESDAHHVGVLQVLAAGFVEPDAGVVPDLATAGAELDVA